MTRSVTLNFQSAKSFPSNLFRKCLIPKEVVDEVVDQVIDEVVNDWEGREEDEEEEMNTVIGEVDILDEVK